MTTVNALCTVLKIAGNVLNSSLSLEQTIQQVSYVGWKEFTL